MPNVTIRPALVIDPAIFTRQRELLAELAHSLDAGKPITIHPNRADDIVGLESLCGALADCIEESA